MAVGASHEDAAGGHALAATQEHCDSTGHQVALAIDTAECADCSWTFPAASATWHRVGGSDESPSLLIDTDPAARDASGGGDA